MVEKASIVALACVALLAAGALAAESPQGGAEASDQPLAPRTVEMGRLDLKLPAAYWEAMSPDQVQQQMRGGCMGAQPAPGLLSLVHHLDAQAQIWVIKSQETFLMRNREDLEKYIDGYVRALRSQIGDQAEEINQSSEERDGMLIHRLEVVTTPQAAGGGCPAAPTGGTEARRLHFQIIDYYLRPQGHDAFFYRVTTQAPAEVYEELAPEVQYILSSIRFTGQLADSFFAPEAPAEKVPTGEEAAEQFGRGGGRWTWVMVAGAILIVWWMMRRRKQQQAVGGE